MRQDKGYMIGRGMIMLGYFFLTAAMGLLGYNLYESKQAEANAKGAFASLSSVIREKQEKSRERSEDEIPDYVINPQMDMPVEQIDGRDYIGYLTIPTFDLNLPVLSETSDSNLKYAPCRYEGSIYQNSMIIGAHNYRRHFGRIDELGRGEKVIFTDVDGNRFSYQVADVEILKPEQTKELVESEWDLSLYTCTLGGRTRYVVRCEK